MKEILTGFLADESKTKSFAQKFATSMREARSAENLTTEQENLPGWVVYLEGDLGAGKSFFSRAFIQDFLPGQKVKSPTYTLVETYQTELGKIHHFDLYRLCDPEELEFLAIRDLLEDSFVSLVEWPSKGAGVLPKADILIQLGHAESGRQFSINAMNERAKVIVKKLTQKVGTDFDK
ncbi:MAG: tRNA (adenosine(37)-N6)-threonylcarbamoyltransferase complex ATPase subunit type 1 TsaE [Hydrogenovibrio sp.]|nr:tRNA (adenosine(37)-N6)-threonylcarbamoyltransferase complex ATPase subunit type 1 TsaE [Hydrogenovibrio sp.]